MRKSQLFNLILNFVSEEMEIPTTEITGTSKRFEVVDARSIAIRLLREQGLYPDQIAKLMNKTTACVRTLSNHYDQRKQENKMIDIIAKRIRSKVKTD